MNDADKANLDDLKDIERAMIDARQALIKVMAGHPQSARDAFNYHVGFACGRLQRVCDRVYGGREGEGLPEKDGETDP